MTTQNPDLANLYNDLKTRCGLNCGLLVTEEVFTSTVSAGIATLTTGQAVPTVIRGVSFTTTMRRLGNFSVSLIPGPDSEVHVVVAGVELSAAFHRSGVPADELSTITFTVGRVQARLAIENGRIVAYRSSYDVDPVLTLAPTRAAAVTALGWDTQPDKLDTFKRMEDTTLFSGPALVADQFLGNIANLPLRQWLSGLALGDPMSIELFDNTTSGAGVLIRTLASSSLTRAAACPCADAGAPELTVTVAGNLSVALATATRTNAPNPAFELHSGAHFDKTFVYLYVPEPVVSTAFGPSVYPAIYISGGGSYGPAQYSWSGTLVFRSLSATIDAANASIVIGCDLGMHLSARAWVNLPCDGEQELARADVDGEINDVSIRVSFVFDRTTKRLVLDSVLERHDVTNLNVNLSGIAGLAWPLNLVLAQIVKHNAPGMISQALRSAVSSGRFTLLELRQLIEDALGAQGNLQGTYADASGFVIGVGYGG